MADSVYLHMRVTRKIIENSAGVTLMLDGALPCEPGQFVMVWVPGVEERPFTLMNDNPVSLTIAAVGPLTRALCALNEGDSVWLRGPYGHGYPIQGDHLLLLGGGSGIASLALLARYGRSRGLSVRTVLGARCSALLMLAWYMSDLCEQLVVATDDGSCGFHGTVLQAALPLVPWASAVYACGPEGMLAALAADWTPQHPPCWVNLERNMRCGIGVCGTCHCGSRLVCADGPVFPLPEVADELHRCRA